MRRSLFRPALAALALFPLLWGAVAFAALPSARPGQAVLVIGGPFSDGAGVLIARAGGYPVGPAIRSLGQTAHSQDPAFLSRLRAAGAFLLLDAGRLSFFTCGPDA